MSEMLFTFPGGLFVPLVTEVVLVNNTAKVIDTLVPTGELWKLLTVQMVNNDDQNRDGTIKIFDVAAATNLLGFLGAGTLNATSGRLLWPNSGNAGLTYGFGWGNLVYLEAGNILRCEWEAPGVASTGSTDADGLIINYLKVEI